MWDEEVKINLKEKTLFFLALPCLDRVTAVPGIFFFFTRCVSDTFVPKYDLYPYSY